jgi:arginyl-tRNA--protein-N-Asp/Glu arginylyltransferase
MQNSESKRGRPALLLNKAELMAYVDHVKKYNIRDQVTQNAVREIQASQFEMQNLSPTALVIVKQAIKPFRQLQKVELLYQQLSKSTSHDFFEKKFVELYQQYQRTPEDQTLNILKTMATQYVRFKDNKADENSLKLYLNQLEKKENKAKRNADNKKKFELGGALLALLKTKNMNVTQLTAEQIIRALFSEDMHFNLANCNTIIFQEMLNVGLSGIEARALFPVVLDQLTNYNDEDGLPIYLKEIIQIKSQNG